MIQNVMEQAKLFLTELFNQSRGFVSSVKTACTFSMEASADFMLICAADKTGYTS